MTRAQRKARVQGIVEQYVERFRRELAKDPGYDIRGKIDKEKDSLHRGAMLAAERQVYREMRGQNGIAMGDTYGGDLDHGDITLEEPEKGQFFDKLWGAE